MTHERILLIEDEPDIAEVLQYNLEKEGFEVETARRGDAGLEAIRRGSPDLILLDLMLPGIDGLELTRLLKRDNATARLPIVMLTARGEEVDRIVGLELGADDYISKPFSPREVVLRVKAVLRRFQHEESEPEHLAIGGIELDISAHQLRVRGKEMPLTATEFRLLRLLMERSGRVQTRGQLLSDVWGYAEDIDSRTVDTHIRRLRRKLGSEADRIETVIGVGYRLRP
jgi:two-component system phosphate regulon response regulator PhoB